MTEYVLIVVISYLFGCIQPAYILGRIINKIDIREHGSNNAGASNVTMVLGWKYGILTGLIDIAKAVIPIVIIRNLYPESVELLFFAGIGIIVGHIFPFYLNFKGGKGTASLIGMSFAIDFKVGIILGLTIVLITIITDYIVFGTLAIDIIFPIIIWINGYPLISIVLTLCIVSLSVYKHIPNIIRIIHKQEKGLRGTFNKSGNN